MSDKLHPGSATGQGLAALSLVTTITCAFANGAVASPPPFEANAELSARIAVLVERLNLREPALVRDLPPERKIAQWRN